MARRRVMLAAMPKAMPTRNYAAGRPPVQVAAPAGMSSMADHAAALVTNRLSHRVLILASTMQGSKGHLGRLRCRSIAGARANASPDTRFRMLGHSAPAASLLKPSRGQVVAGLALG